MFIPDKDFFSDKLTSFRNKFSFIDSIVGSVELIESSLSASDSFGSLNLNLSSNESKYNYGSGQINVLDVSWYKKYKPYGDQIISAMLWLVFIFNVFKQLPGIINGVSGAAIAADGIGQHDLERRGGL